MHEEKQSSSDGCILLILIVILSSIASHNFKLLEDRVAVLEQKLEAK